MLQVFKKIFINKIILSYHNSLTPPPPTHTHTHARAHTHTHTRTHIHTHTFFWNRTLPTKNVFLELRFRVILQDIQTFWPRHSGCNPASWLKKLFQICLFKYFAFSLHFLRMHHDGFFPKGFETVQTLFFFKEIETKSSFTCFYLYNYSVRVVLVHHVRFND